MGQQEELTSKETKTSTKSRGRGDQGSQGEDFVHPVMINSFKCAKNKCNVNIFLEVGSHVAKAGLKLPMWP